MNEMKVITQQKGVALVTALVLLVGVTLFSLSSLYTGLTEMSMAGNEEERIRAFQRAQSGIEVIMSDGSNFTVAGAVGASNCTATRSGETCNRTNLSLPDGLDETKHWVKVERLTPEFGCPPRVWATSCDAFKVAHFAVDSRFSNVLNRGGRAQIQEGYMFLVPEPGEQTITNTEGTPDG